MVAVAVAAVRAVAAGEVGWRCSGLCPTSPQSANGAFHFQPGATPQEKLIGVEKRAESPIHRGDESGFQPPRIAKCENLGRWPRLWMGRAFGPSCYRDRLQRDPALLEDHATADDSVLHAPAHLAAQPWRVR
jgi:hypothetical protein